MVDDARYPGTAAHALGAVGTQTTRLAVAASTGRQVEARARLAAAEASAVTAEARATAAAVHERELAHTGTTAAVLQLAVTHAARLRRQVDLARQRCSELAAELATAAGEVDGAQQAYREARGKAEATARHRADWQAAQQRVRARRDEE